MKQFTTQAIVLRRTNFNEADRIISFITADHGKVRGMARGVRKLKSKLAGGLELFSISEVTFGIGRGEVNPIVSTKLKKHYDNIVKDLDRTNAAYALMKQLDSQTEDAAEPGYFDLLASAFESLDDLSISLEIIKLWFGAQLLKLSGRQPNLDYDVNGQKLQADKNYRFDYEDMAFVLAEGREKLFTANDIKFLRLLFGQSRPGQLAKIDDSKGSIGRCSIILSRIKL